MPIDVTNSIATPGAHIESVIRAAISLRAKAHQDVTFTFNGAKVTIKKATSETDALVAWSETMAANAASYRASPAGQKAARDAQAYKDGIAAKVERLTSTMEATLTSGDRRAILRWLSAASECDHIGVPFPCASAATLLYHAGYARNANCGAEFMPEDEDNVFRYLVGQAMTFLAMGMVPHHVIQNFVRDYLTKFGA